MEKIRVAIIDQDCLYAEALGAYLSLESEEFEIRVADKSIFEEEKHEEFHLALVDERLLDKIKIDNIEAKWLILLTEDPIYENQGTKSSMSNKIFKYLPGPEIAREIRFIYALLSGKGSLLCRDKRTVMIGLISGASGTGKTVISIALARDLSKRNEKKVLYICMDNFDSTGVYFREAHGVNRTISDFLYFIFKGPGKNPVVPPESFMFKDAYGLYAFYPGAGMNEISTLNIKELEFFIQYIYENGNFDYVVIDFKDDLSLGSQYLLQLCKEIFVIYGKGITAQAKTIAFTKYFEYLLRSLEIIKYKKIYNFSSAIPEEKEEGFFIEVDNNSFYESDNILEISIAGAFGSGVRTIKEYILRK